MTDILIMSGQINRQLEQKKRSIQKILSVLNKSAISEEGYDSTKKPFFLAGNIKDFVMDYKQIDGIPQRLNRNIALIYKIIGSPKKEVYIGNWTLLSLEKASERYEAFCKDGQKNVFDIGYRYMGMGHVEVISCDLETHLLFYRPDGGSNGYDREANYKDIVKDGATKYNKFYFSKWFYNI